MFHSLLIGIVKKIGPRGQTDLGNAELDQATAELARELSAGCIHQKLPKREVKLVDLLGQENIYIFLLSSYLGAGCSPEHSLTH